MRIATWNVTSVRRVPRLLPWLDERRPDVVCLQETNLADGPFVTLLGEELEARGYWHSIRTAGRPHALVLGRGAVAGCERTGGGR